MNFEALRMAALVLMPMTALVYACVTGAAIWRGLRLTPLTLPIVTVWVGLLYWALTSGSAWLLLTTIVGVEISLIGWIVYLIVLVNERWREWNRCESPVAIEAYRIWSLDNLEEAAERETRHKPFWIKGSK